MAELVPGSFAIAKNFLPKIYSYLFHPSALSPRKHLGAELTAHARSAVCDFQLSFMNLFMSVSKRHQKLKESVADDLCIRQQCLNELEVTHYGMAGKINAQICEAIVEYFYSTHHSWVRPRVALYAFSGTSDEPRYSKMHSLPFNYIEASNDKIGGDYSLFDHITQEGSPYLCNNIPREICINSEYKHADFDLIKARRSYDSYKLADRRLVQRWCQKLGVYKLYAELKEYGDQDWDSLAIDKDGAGVRAQKNKSHIAVPITYKKHAERSDLDQSVMKLLKLQDDEPRSILGVIVVDHIDPHYFDEMDIATLENIDINVLTVFSDMLSLSMALELNYLEESETYQKLKKVV